MGCGTSQGVPLVAHDNPGIDLKNPRNWRTRTSVHVVIEGHHVQVDAAPEFRLQCLRNDIRDVDTFILTHGHADHVAGNAALRERWPGLPILVGRGDADKLVDPRGNLSAAFGLPFTSPPADRELSDGDTVELAGFSLAVTAIPGHSRGHVVFRVGDTSPPLVIGGDVLFREGIGRTDFQIGRAHV